MPHLTTPVYFFVSKDDKLARPEKVQKMFKNYKGKNKRIDMLKGAHNSVRYRNFYEKSVKFFKELAKKDRIGEGPEENMMEEEDSEISLKMKQRVSGLNVSKKKFKSFLVGEINNGFFSEKKRKIGIGKKRREIWGSDQNVGFISHFVEDHSFLGLKEKGKVRMFKTKMIEHRLKRFEERKKEKRFEI